MSCIDDGQLAQHGTDSRVPWVVIRGAVYDVSELLQTHPGGVQPLLRCAGRDGTTVFESAGHSVRANSRLASLKVGDLSQSERKTAAGAAASLEATTLQPGHYVEAHGLTQENNCNRYRGRVQWLEEREERPGAVVVFPPPHLQRFVSLATLKAPDPKECETVVIEKLAEEPLGLTTRGGTYLAGAAGWYAGESFDDKWGLNRLAGRWLLRVNGVVPEEVSGVVYVNAIGEERVVLEVGPMAPCVRDLVRYQYQGVEGVGKVVGISENAVLAIQPDDGREGFHLRGCDATLIPQPSPELYESPAAWHSNRRLAIMKAHPEVEMLPKYQPLSLPIVVAACGVHAYVALLCAGLPWWQVFLLAYTAGALCKMVQFAISHEICHNVVMPALERPAARMLAMKLVTLPSVGTGLYNYYAHHHMGHHAHLGTQTIDDVMGAFAAGAEIDGDMLHSYTAQIRPVIWDEKQLQHGWNKRVGWDYPKAVRPLLRFARDTCVHVGHLAVILFWNGFATLFMTLLCIRRWICCIDDNDLRESRVPMIGQDGEMPDVAVQTLVWTGLLTAMWAVVYNTTPYGVIGMLKLLLYLVLSELFLSGFLLHPSGAYFLGVHKTAPGVSGRGEHGRRCQPTQSCYASRLYDVCTLYLTRHVEHHDFPNVPWSSLPALRRIAPEFYTGLDSLPSPLTTLCQYHFTDQQWTYGCR